MALGRSATRSLALGASSSDVRVAAFAWRDDPSTAYSVLLALAMASTWLGMSVLLDVGNGFRFIREGPWPWTHEWVLGGMLMGAAFLWWTARSLRFVCAESGAGLRLAAFGFVARGVARLSWTMVGPATGAEWDGGVATWAPYAGLVATVGTLAIGAGLALVLLASVADARRGRPRLLDSSRVGRLPLAPWIRPSRMRRVRPVVSSHSARVRRRRRGRGLPTWAVRVIATALAVPASFVLWSVAWGLAGV